MGVIGLTSFMDDNPKFLTDHRLHDVEVVIDGNNLYYFLYYNYFSINVLYGGDYDCYAHCVRYFFRTLRSCNIEPYVIFDGGYDVNDRKLKTTLKRQKDRLQNANCLSKGQKGIVLPILSFDVFRLILDELQIRHMTCDFEADDQLAVLSKKLDIPILSNDSDFYIYDLPAGFIIFDYINLEVQEMVESDGSSYKYLNVQIYKLNNFVECYKGLRKELIPIFATLVGNDFVDCDEFKNFFASVKLPKVDSNPQMTRRRQRMIAVIMWLQTQASVQSTIDTIVVLMPVNQQEKINQLLLDSVKSYTDFNDYLDYFSADKTTEHKLKTQLKTYGGNLVPRWIIEQFRVARYPLMAVNALTLHRNLLLQQVEVLSDPSSYKCSRPIRQIMYSILLSLDKKLNERPAAKKDKRRKERYIEEYDRESREIRCGRIEPLTEMPDGSAIPYLQELPHLSPDERSKLFLLSANVDRKALNKDVPGELQFILIVIIYWIKNASPKVPEELVNALIGSMLKLMAPTEDEVSLQQVDSSDAADISSPKDEETLPSFIPKENEMEQFRRSIVASCSQQQIDCVKKNLEKFSTTPVHSITNKFHTHIVHGCSQFQSCFQALMHLNLVLLSPFVCPSPALVYNGTTVYNLCLELQRRSHCRSYIPELLGVKSPLALLYRNLTDTIIDYFKEDELAFAQGGGSAKGKKKGKGKKKKVVDHEVDGKGNNDDVEEQVNANCELSNRFQGLNISFDD